MDILIKILKKRQKRKIGKDFKEYVVLLK